MPVARRLYGGLALGACALAVTLALLGPWRARAATALPGCAPSKLHLKFVGSQGAAGHLYLEFAYKNTGSTCTIKGYPKVILLDSHGHALSQKVHHHKGYPAKAVTIAHNKRAFFTFQYADSGACPPPATVAHKLRVFAPGATAGTVYAPGVMSMCKGSAQVWPLRAKPVPFARDAASAPAVRAASGTRTCVPANLRLDAVGGQGFTSHRQIIFALRNTGSATCHLRGYPGIGLLDSHAGLLSPNVSRVAGSKPTITLHAWQRAFFDFVYTVGGPCVPHTLTVYGLQVTPPNDTGHLDYYLGKTVMCGSPHGTVSPVRAHM